MAAVMQKSECLVNPALGQSIWPHLYARAVSGGQWRAYPYLRTLSCVIAEGLLAGTPLRIVVNAPPRHGKSEFCSFWLPLWFLDHHPTGRVILVAYDDTVARDFGRRLRNAAQDHPQCNVTLSEDSTAAGRWHTSEGGQLIATGVGGPITGRGADLLLVDDPYKNWQDAASPTVRRHVEEWFRSTALSRLEPGGSALLIGSRWHERDLSAALLAKPGEWRAFSFPALAEADDPLGRAVGEPLVPERYGREALEKIKTDVGRRPWEALFQQRPAYDLEPGERVYANFADANLDASITLASARPLHVSVDFNSRPHMHLEIGQYDQRLDIFTCSDELASPQLRNAQLAGRALAAWVLKNGGWRWPELCLFGDATGRALNVETSDAAWDVLIAAFRTLLPAVRVRVLVPRANPRISERILAFNEALEDVRGLRRYLVHPRCTRLIEDLKRVRWSEAASIDKTDTDLSHASDAEGYRVWFLRAPSAFLSEPGGMRDGNCNVPQPQVQLGRSLC